MEGTQGETNPSVEELHKVLGPAPPPQYVTVMVALEEVLVMREWDVRGPPALSIRSPSPRGLARAPLPHPPPPSRPPPTHPTPSIAAPAFSSAATATWLSRARACWSCCAR
jgi:hypothetical protein